ncbi:hypothetical protein KBA63_04115 [Candidatus Woesebacteria bacterium]|jgi:hypothetical protein|nr:hypothetical protein [Candidatus Woesebacteria bacterium]
MAKKPWLIARGRVHSSKVVFDYMGSAQFEFGKIAASLARIVNPTSVLKEHTIIARNSKQVVLCGMTATEGQFDAYAGFFQQMIEPWFYFKEWNRFDDAVKVAAGISVRNMFIEDFWVDIENDVIFTVGPKEKMAGIQWPVM